MKGQELFCLVYTSSGFEYFEREVNFMKYVLVTGGVVSGLGKGVTASSMGVILQACGHRVTSIKIGEQSCHDLEGSHALICKWGSN